MLAREVLIVKLYLTHVFLDIARRDECVGAGDGFRRIVYPEEHDRHPGFQGDVVEAFLPLRIGFSGAFGGDGQVEPADRGEAFGHLIDQRILLAAVDGDAPHGFEHQVEREEEPFLFHHEVGVASQRAIEKLADELGDVFWGIALACELGGYSFKGLWKVYDEYDSIKLHYYLPKIFMKGNVEMSEKNIQCIISFIKTFAKQCRISPLECLKRNIAKLADRKTRGVIKGNGDER